MHRHLSVALVLTAASVAVIAAPRTAPPVKTDVKHELSAAQLSSLQDTMYWDKATKAKLTPALKKLLGAQWADFDKAFFTTSGLKFENGKLYGSGFRGGNSAALEFRADGSVVAAYTDGETCTDYGMVNPGYLCDELGR